MICRKLTGPGFADYIDKLLRGGHEPTATVRVFAQQARREVNADHELIADALADCSAFARRRAMRLQRQIDAMNRRSA